MEITLTEQEKKFLVQFAKKQCEGAKDNLGTATPIHVVERINKEFVQDGSDEVWINLDTSKEYESFTDLMKDLKSDNPKSFCQACNDVNIVSGRYIVSYVPVAFFFTLDEARRYKNEYQAHNCGNCRIYTYDLGYDNQGDLPVFRELLMKMGNQLSFI